MSGVKGMRFGQPRFRGRSKAVMHKNDTWEPTEWRPVYEQIVILYESGRFTQEKLGELFGYKNIQIHKIVNCSKANEVRRKMIDKLHEKGVDDITSRLARLTEHSMRALEHVMVDNVEDYLERAPFAVIDRAMRVLQGVGRLKTSDEDKKPVVNNIFITPELQERIEKGIELADEVEKEYKQLKAVG